MKLSSLHFRERTTSQNTSLNELRRTTCCKSMVLLYQCLIRRRNFNILEFNTARAIRYVVSVWTEVLGSAVVEKKNRRSPSGYDIACVLTPAPIEFSARCCRLSSRTRQWCLLDLFMLLFVSEERRWILWNTDGRTRLLVNNKFRISISGPVSIVIKSLTKQRSAINNNLFYTRTHMPVSLLSI